MPRPYNVLFLCTSNAARSILAEALVNELGNGKFHGFSAGTYPASEVHPYAIDLLSHLGHDPSFARPKSWQEFAEPGAPAMDFIFTVCDQAAAEPHPDWPGHPATALWTIPDPRAAGGNEAEHRLAFAESYRLLRNRISLLLALPLESLDELAIHQTVTEIGSAS